MVLQRWDRGSKIAGYSMISPSIVWIHTVKLGWFRVTGLSSRLGRAGIWPRVAFSTSPKSGAATYWWYLQQGSRSEFNRRNL